MTQNIDEQYEADDRATMGDYIKEEEAQTEDEYVADDRATMGDYIKEEEAQTEDEYEPRGQSAG
jgi:hypothetical protein